MTNLELAAYRRFLGFSVTEAADLIGTVTPRTWQRWESGSVAIKDDVVEKVTELLIWYSRAHNAARSGILETSMEMEGMPDSIPVKWFETKESFVETPDAAGDKRLPEYWRPHQNLCCALKSEFPQVTFDVK